MMMGRGWHSVVRIFKGFRGRTGHHTMALSSDSDSEAVTDIALHHFRIENRICPILTKCLSRARMRAIERCKGRTEEEVQEEVRMSVLKVKDLLTQASLGVELQTRNELRLWSLSRGDKSETKHVVSKNKKLRMDKKKANVITLSGLKIFPKVREQGGETIVGSLEVHANGFLYAASSPNFHFHFLYRDVKLAFFRVEYDKMLPLLHFHMRHPIKVGTEMRQEIQFHLVQPVEQRSYNNLDKIEEEKQTRDRVPGEDLKNFVHKVEEKCSYVPVTDCYPFFGDELHKSNEFQGNLPFNAPTVFGLTFSALVRLVDEPFVVVDLFSTVEFVSLRLSPWGKPVQIDMTIVFQDFKRDLLHINSIPIDALDLIKRRCNHAMVKYYETYEYFDWDSIVKEIADSPRNFFDIGGWSIYEDFATKCYYKYYYKKELEGYCGSEEMDTLCGSDDEGEEVTDDEGEGSHTLME